MLTNQRERVQDHIDRLLADARPIRVKRGRY